MPEGDRPATKGARSASKRTVLVSGITGHQGGAVARSLLRSGISVRGLTRKPPPSPAPELSGVQWVAGDLQDEQSLGRALQGADGFFLVTTPFTRGWGQPPDPEGEVKSGVTALQAAKDAGTSQVVLSTVMSAGSVKGPSGVAHLDSKVKIEAKARELGVPRTNIRPAYFMENHLNPFALQGIRSGIISLPVKPTTRIPMVAVRDIGEVAARAFESPQTRIGKEVDLGGDYKSLPEVAELFAQKLGTPVRYVEQSDDQARAQIGQDGLNMYRGFDRGVPRIDIPAIEKDWDLRLTRFEDLLRDTSLG
jgi:uncharacterized protein YbjT (DUF2867 family)